MLAYQPGHSADECDAHPDAQGHTREATEQADNDVWRRRARRLGRRAIFQNVRRIRMCGIRAHSACLPLSPLPLSLFSLTPISYRPSRIAPEPTARLGAVISPRTSASGPTKTGPRL